MENNTVTQPPKEGIATFRMVREMIYGAGQVMFQENGYTGLLIILGIFWGSYETGHYLVGWGALIGLIVSTIVGHITCLPREEGRQGLWGFNGILVGCAFPTFLGSSLYMWLALIICAALSTWARTALNNLLRPLKINSLTFPFIITTWIFLLASRQMKGLPPDGLATPELATTYRALFLSTDIAYHDLHISTLLATWLRNIGQVFLIDSWITGLFFLIALAISHRWAAIWAGVASAIAILVGALWHAPAGAVVNGLYGYSAVLTGIALGCTFYRPGLLSAIWAIFGIVTTVFVQAAMDSLFLPLGLPALTAPFCITTWLFLLPLFKLDEYEPDHSFWKTRTHREAEKKVKI